MGVGSLSMQDSDFDDYFDDAHATHPQKRECWGAGIFRFKKT